MKKLGLLTLAAIAAGTMAVAPASASDGTDACGPGGDSVLGPMGLTLGVISLGDGNLGTIYIDDRDFATGHGTWIYAETNGQFNLQRGGQSLLGPDLGGADACDDGGTNGPDTIIF